MSRKNNETREAAIEKKIGVVFKDKDLLHRALVHRSYLNENKSESRSNERLEFLGDAVLEFVVSENIFGKFTQGDEGLLTALRAKLVNTTSLALVAEQLSLGQSLYLSKGEEESGGRKNRGLLANTVEALIGAIFVDQGLESAQKFIARYILPKVSQITKESLKDAKSLLQEFVQANGYPTPDYRVVEEIGPDHAKEFKVEVLIGNKSFAQGEGLSKQAATQEAAKKALELWKKQ